MTASTATPSNVAPEAFGVIVINGTFGCYGCTTSEQRDALGAMSADRHDLRGSLAPVTACCNERVRYSSALGAYVVWGD